MVQYEFINALVLHGAAGNSFAKRAPRRYYRQYGLILVNFTVNHNGTTNAEGVLQYAVNLFRAG
jgi:hypothetical protein